MKETIHPGQINKMITDFFHALDPGADSVARKRPANVATRSKRDRPERREFFYYKQVIDDETQQVIGHLSDISLGGFKLDSQNPVPINKESQFRIKLTSELADKPFMVFSAKSKWCKIDPIDPYVYNIGYQLTQISPEDFDIFARMMEKYARRWENRPLNLRRSNKW